MTITIPSGFGPKSLRLRAINAGASVMVMSSGPGVNLPRQGHIITSVGTIQGTSSTANATRIVTVERSLPYLPAVWDFGMYTNTGSFK